MELHNIYSYVKIVLEGLYKMLPVLFVCRNGEVEVTLYITIFSFVGLS